MIIGGAKAATIEPSAQDQNNGRRRRMLLNAATSINSVNHGHNPKVISANCMCAKPVGLSCNPIPTSTQTRAVFLQTICRKLM